MTARLVYFAMAAAIVGTVHQAGYGLMAIALAVLFGFAWGTR